MTTPLDLQLGPLRSEITFTLHTQYAHKLWMGRPMIRNGEGKVTQSSIISVPNCFAMLTQIQRAASEDDPYADDYLSRNSSNGYEGQQTANQQQTTSVSPPIPPSDNFDDDIPF